MGAPCIDSKRPYGNSDVIGDMYEILTDKVIDENELDSQDIDYDEFVDSLHDKYEKLHRETETALQIVLSTGKFEIGKYVLNNYGKDWVKVQ